MKSHLKRILSLVLCGILLLSLMPSAVALLLIPSARAEETVPSPLLLLSPKQIASPVAEGRIVMKDNLIPEQISVGVAQNHDAVQNKLAAMNGHSIMGRSYTSKGYHYEDGAKMWGYNFAEQFEYALSVDPKVIFVTGRNEWTASRHEIWPQGSTTAIENAFPDTFNDEYSRDIEPSKGDLQDHYYYQLVNFVRRYKGVRSIPTPGKKPLSTSTRVPTNGSPWSRITLPTSATRPIATRKATALTLLDQKDRHQQNCEPAKETKP